MILNVVKFKNDDGYLPTYAIINFTNDLHRIFGLETGAEITTYKKF